MLTNLDHDRQWFNTLTPPSHESLVLFVCRSFSELRRCRPSLLQMQSCQWKHVVGSWQNVALAFVAVNSYVLVLILDMYYRIYLMMDVLLLWFNVIHLRNISCFYVQSASGNYANACVDQCVPTPTTDVWHGITFLIPLITQAWNTVNWVYV